MQCSIVVAVAVFVALASAQVPCKVASGACGPNSVCQPTSTSGQEECVCIDGYTQTFTGCQFLPTLVSDNGYMHISGLDVVFDSPTAPSVTVGDLVSFLNSNSAQINATASTVQAQATQIQTLETSLTGLTATVAFAQLEANAQSTTVAQLSAATAIQIGTVSAAVLSAAQSSVVVGLSTGAAAVSTALSSQIVSASAQTAAIASTINRLQTVDIPNVAAADNAALAALKATEIAQADSTAQKGLTIASGTSTVVTNIQNTLSTTQSVATAAQAFANSINTTFIPNAQSAAVAAAAAYTSSSISSLPNTNTINTVSSKADMALACAATNALYNPITNSCGNPRADYESAWFQLPQQAGPGSYAEVTHAFGVYPDRVLVVATSMMPSDPANNFMFHAAGCAFCDDECDDNGGLVYAYNTQTIRMWAPSKYNGNPYGATIFVADGWGPNYQTDSLNYPNDIWVKAYAWKNFTQKNPEYDSNFFLMSAQADSGSFRELVHGFGSLPHRVQVITKVDSGVNAGYYFEGVGAATGDDESNEYGGLAFAYDKSRVRLWAPDNNNNNNPNGYLIFVGDGWGGEVNSIAEKTAYVRVRVWKEDNRVPAPDVETPWIALSSQAGAASFKQLPHNFGHYPSRVVVQAQAIDGPNSGFIFESVGAGTSDDEADNYGGLVSAYDHNNVRLWAPSVSNAGTWGRIIFIEDGWGGEVNTQSSQTALVRIRAWR